MSIVNDAWCSAVLALADGGERGPSAAGALGPVAVGTGACGAGRACFVIGIDDIRGLTDGARDA